MPDIVWVTLPAVLFGLGMLAYFWGLRWLQYRREQVASNARMDRLENELKTHKDLHERAIANLVKEMREELGKVSTKTSIALDRSGKRLGRFRV